MKIHKSFKQYKSEIQRCIYDSVYVKRPQYVHQKERAGRKVLFIGSSMKSVHDVLFFFDESYLRFEISIEECGREINIDSYAVHWENEDGKNIFSILYEWDNLKARKQADYDATLGDSYQHPKGHLHINKHNQLRLPTNFVDFIQIFRAIESWREKRRGLP